MNALIKSLVQQKKVAAVVDSDRPLESPQITQKRRNWESLKKQPIYLLEVFVKVGRQSIHLEGADLGINPQVLASLQAIALYGYSAKISKRLKEYASKLQSAQKLFYKRFTTYSEPFRFVHEKDLPQVLAAIEQMQAEADQLRDELIVNYEEEFTGFLEVLEGIMHKAQLQPPQIEAALARYADAYPSEEDWASDFLQVIVEGPTKIPSLLEEIQRDTELAQQLAAQSAANLESQKLQLEKEKLEAAVKLKQQQLAAIQKSQEIFNRTLLQALGNAQIRARDEAYGAIADLIDRFAICQPGDVTNRTQDAWNTAFERLDTLVAHDESLKPIIDKAKVVRDLYLSPETNLQNLYSKLEDFQHSLKEIVKNDITGEGATKLSKLIAFDKQYKDLATELDNLAKNPEPTRLKELQGKVYSIASLYQYRERDLMKRFQVADEAVKVSLLIAPPQPKLKAKKVFDAEAGF